MGHTPKALAAALNRRGLPLLHQRVETIEALAQVGAAHGRGGCGFRRTRRTGSPRLQEVEQLAQSSGVKIKRRLDAPPAGHYRAAPLGGASKKGSGSGASSTRPPPGGCGLRPAAFCHCPDESRRARDLRSRFCCRQKASTLSSLFRHSSTGRLTSALLRHLGV